MTHPSDDLLVRQVSGELDGAVRTAVDQHLQACAECRRRATEFEEMDGVLRRLPPMAVPADFTDRVRARVVLSSGGARFSWRQAAAAALLLAAGLSGGWTLARATAPPAPAAIVRNADGPKFALIFAEDPATWENVSREERERRFEEFMVWLRGIGDTSVRLGGTQLDNTRGYIVGASAPAVDPELALSGFIVIRAQTYDEARAHAQRCPLLARGGQVIVRRLR